MDQQQGSKRPFHPVAVTCAVALAVVAVITLTTLNTRGPAAASSRVGDAVGASQINAPMPEPQVGPSTPAATTPISSQVEAMPTTTALEPLSSSDPAQPAPTPGSQAAAEAESAATTIESRINGRQMYATGSVNVRDAPGTDGTTVIDGLAGGQPVSAGDTVNGWVPVHAGDTFGWVSSDYLADGAPPVAPALEPSADSLPEAASSGNWMQDLIPQIDPAGEAIWVFERNHAWGASDGHTNYIDPDVPADKRFSVMVHELSHVKQVEVYGSLSKSIAALSAINGGSSADNTANESTADCMALMLGATWVNYGCQDSLRGAASAILAGQRP